MPKNLLLTISWIILASFAVAMAFWQAQVAVAREQQARHRPLTPPAKTKHLLRKPVSSFAGDPVEDYIARCRKGMTDQEIGWIIEDFQNAGLDQKLTSASTATELFNLRIAQNRWYHDTLMDGLRLNAEQSSEVRTKLLDLLGTEMADFLAKEESVFPDQWVEEMALRLMPDVAFALQLEDEFMPWKLCKLTPSQESLTWKNILPHKPESPDPMADKPIEGLEWLSSWELFSNEYEMLIAGASGIFPFFSKQRLEMPEKDLLDARIRIDQTRRFQPAQLKTLLLFHPEMAVTLQQDLAFDSK